MCIYMYIMFIDISIARWGKSNLARKPSRDTATGDCPWPCLSVGYWLGYVGRPLLGDMRWNEHSECSYYILCILDIV